MDEHVRAAFDSDFPRSELNASIPDRFRKIVENYPDRLAVKTQTAGWSYAELDAAANRIANGLVRRRGNVTETVGLMIERELPAIAAILGVLKCGKIYVPLDRSHPPDRLAAVMQDCEIRTLITDIRPSVLNRILPAGCTVISPEDLSANESPAFRHPPIPANALAAIFYTSGSTGRPKGAMQSHGNVLHRVMLYTNLARITALDRFSLVTAPTYSASLPNVFGALLNGAAIFPFNILDRGLTQIPTWLSGEKLTIYFSVPSVFRQWTALIAGEDFSDLRLIVIAGEPVIARDIEIYKNHFSERCAFVNLLASNEAGFIRANILRKNSTNVEPVVPVGYALEDKHVMILDDNGQEIEPGQTGEIAIRSAFLSPGYWRQPELTAAAFVADATSREMRIYRTDDLGCVLPDGCLVYKGRKTLRTKIRGIRVELEEIDAALCSHPSVCEAITAVRENSANEPYLVAYVVCREQSRLTTRVLRSDLAQKLPSYMVPSRFVLLESLPKSPNGKVDRSALPETSGDLHTVQPFIPPRDDIEREIAGIWETVLGVRPIGIQDSFFESGGDSLKALELLARLERTFGRGLPPATLLRAPTVECLASILRQGKTRERWPSLIQIQKGSGPVSVFCVLFDGGFKSEFYSFSRLAPLISRDYSFYGVIARGTDGCSTPHRSVEEMAAAYIEEIKSIQPQGPYFILGECFSASVAYETARQLRNAGEGVGLLAVLDGLGHRHWVFRYLGNHLGAHVRHLMVNIRDTSTASYIRNSIPCHVREMRRIGSVQWLFKVIRRKRLTRSTRRTAIATESATPIPKPSRALQQAHKTYSITVRRYERPPYDGKIMVIANEEWYRADSTLGWKASGGIETHSIPGDHNTYLKNHTEEVADLLRHAIESTLATEETSRAAIAPPGHRVAS